MAEDEVIISYETLFEILRREKSREELQSLDKNFYNLSISHISRIKQDLSTATQKGSTFDEAERLRLELVNVKKILKELYNRREKKIINGQVSTAAWPFNCLSN